MELEIGQGLDYQDCKNIERSENYKNKYLPKKKAQLKISFFIFFYLSHDDQQSLYSETVERQRIDEAQSIQTHPLRAL